MIEALLADAGVARLRAGNPGPLTLSGTNSWVIGSDPCWVIDPGPDSSPHLAALAAEVARRGSAAGIVLTHRHADHADAVPGLIARLPRPVPVLAGAVDGSGAPATRTVSDGDRLGPLLVLALPGHAPGHLGFVLDSAGGRLAFTGDGVLGEGSVFVGADMAAYLDGLERLEALEPRLICPGHGPVVAEPRAHLAAYRAHRLAREAAVLAAWRRGVVEEDELVREVWGPLREPLLRAATATLRAHLVKLADEGRLSGGATS